MKRNKLLILGAAFALAIGAVVGIASQKEAKEVVAADATLSLANLGSGFTNTSSSNHAGTFTVSNYSFSYFGKKQGSAAFVPKSSDNGYFYNTTAIPGDIQSVTITTNTGAAGGAGYAVAFSASPISAKYTTGGTSQTLDASTTSSPYECSVSGSRYFCVYMSNSKNGQVLNLSISYTATGSAQLTAPSPVYDEVNNKVIWENVDHASSYEVSVNDEEHYETATSPYDGDFQVGETYTVYVKAIGDGTNYTDSPAGSKTFTVPAPFASKQYELCKSINELAAGDSIIIGNSVTGSAKFLSTTQNSNNRGATEDIIITDEKVLSTSDTEVITLGKNGENWTLHANDCEGYLYAASSSNNYLRTRAENSDGNSEWDIEIDANGIASITAQGSYTRNQLKNNGALFACYASGQTSVSIWKEFSNRQLERLRITGSPTKLSGYFDTDEFDPSGITKYEAIYDDDYVRELSAASISWPALTANMGKIKGSYTEGEVTVYTPEYDISVSADSIASISLSGSMGNSYRENDEDWDKGNLVVTANYLSGKQADVTEGSTFTFYSDSTMSSELESPSDLDVGENQTIYVKATYSGVSNAVGYSQIVTIQQAPIFTATLTSTAQVDNGFTISSNKASWKEAGYYQDGGTADSDVNYFVVMGESPLQNPGQKVIKLTARLGAGSDKNQLDHNVEACLVDSNESEIEGTKVVVTKALTQNPASYEAVIPYSSSAYGVKLMHMKENSWNARYYSFSVSYVMPSVNDYLSNTGSVVEIDGTPNTSTSSGTTSIASSQLGVANDTAVVNVKKDGFVFNGDKGENASNAPKYFDSGTNVRLYQGNTLEISASGTITRIEFSFTANYSSGLTASEGDFDGSVWEGSASSITFTNSNQANTQIRITNFAITATKETTSINSLSLRFGAKIAEADWLAMKTKWGITDYGVMLIKTTAANTQSSDSFVQTLFTSNNAKQPLVVNKIKNNTPYADPSVVNGYYTFTVKINVPDDADRTDVYYAAPFVCVGGQYRFLDEIHGSIKYFAAHNNGSTLSPDELSLI